MKFSRAANLKCDVPNLHFIIQFLVVGSVQLLRREEIC